MNPLEGLDLTAPLKTKIIGIWIELKNGDMGQVYFDQPWRTSEFLSFYQNWTPGKFHQFAYDTLHKFKSYSWLFGEINE